MHNFQTVLRLLLQFWEKQGCLIQHGYDVEVGAGTFNPATFLRCLGPEPFNAAYVEGCRRPTDGRYGQNPNRLQHYFQLQVIMKPSPLNIQELYLQSLEEIGFDLKKHDVRFVHDDWESPTLGAAGLGWEVWMDGMEVTQFTYFQSFAGQELFPITAEITYGVERLAIYLQKVNSVYDLKWNDQITYGDIYKFNEVQWSGYNFEHASCEMWQRHFDDFESEALKIVELDLPLAAYDFVLKASHAFNILDARSAISVTERTNYISRIRALACKVATSYLNFRKSEAFPLQALPQNIVSKKEIAGSIDVDTIAGKTADYLLEIGCEELPAYFVDIGIENLKRDIERFLKAQNLGFAQITTFATPRRLAIIVHELDLVQTTKSSEKKGPPITQLYDEQFQLKASANGFFNSLNLSPPASYQSLQQGEAENFYLKEINKVQYLFIKLPAKSRATSKILQEGAASIITNLKFPKKMQWSDLLLSFARPIRWLISLHGPEIIDLKMEKIKCQNHSFGHRFLAPGEILVTKPADYERILMQNFVIANLDARKEAIKKQIDQIETKFGVELVAKEKVLSQVVNLVEWPELILADFDAHFLQLPPEVIISELVEHQKYFPVSQNGKLINKFVITSNLPASEQISMGNQKVIAARLSDGLFLYNEDLQTPIADFNEKLKKMVYNQKFGSIYQKVIRLQKHAAKIQSLLNISTQKLTSRAASICKFDLSSGMIYEFPELQGTMGKYYAQHHGEEMEVCCAIEEHWMPINESAPLPQSATGIIISLADKLDNLIACFGSNQKPTSSSDPFALRRQAIAIIKIIISHKLNIDLLDLIQTLAENFENIEEVAHPDLASEIFNFIASKVPHQFAEQSNLRGETLATYDKDCQDIYEHYLKALAIQKLKNEHSIEFVKLMQVYKRLSGILVDQNPSRVDTSLLKEPVEMELYRLNEQFNTTNDQNYLSSLREVINYTPVLEKFFNAVQINSPQKELKNNRLALLRQVSNKLNQIADLSKF